MTTVAALLIALALQERAPDRPLQGPAASCGSEIPWTLSLEAARKLARESGKPIAWWVPTLDGSPMDRKLVVEKYMLAGPFMMPGVVELLSRNFVPLRLAGDLSHRQAFGLAPMAFIEPGFVFLTADLKVIHKVDRITTFSEEWFTHLLRGVLEKAGRKVETKAPALDAGRRALAEGRPDPALFDGVEGDEARYFRGVALHLAARDEEGRAEWRRIADGRWAWKAAAELARDGPFVRGFEIYEALPLDALKGLPANTTRPVPKPDVARAVRFLLQTQRGSGVWDDSHYNFGGEDSLPNVYMAVTALAAMALRAWGEDARIKEAILRAEAWMRDESRIAAQDQDEIVWAHAYRLLYFAQTRDSEMIARLVKKLEALQLRSGVWRHEYPAPFTTATVLHALHEAKGAGAEVPAGVLARGAQALQSTRGPTGVFAYGYPGTGDAVQGGAGRMPFCELALFLWGKSAAGAVTASLETSFRHHDLLERVRKYDDHADGWRNGGFFFWYDQYGRAAAARAVKAAAALDRQRGIVLAIPEIDGCWVDSHELGRVYGTAMALLTLKLCEK